MRVTDTRFIDDEYAEVNSGLLESEGYILVSDTDAQEYFDFYPNLWYVNGSLTNIDPSS